MDSEYIQALRYKLQKRLKRLNTADSGTFPFALQQVWGYLQVNEITKGILDDLERRSAEEEKFGDETLAESPQIGNTEKENDGICYWVIKKTVLSQDLGTAVTIGHPLDCSASKDDDAIEAFRSTYIEPLFDYIDEQIDDKRSVLALLKKYKHHCEWFHRTELFARFKEDTGRGEKLLALRLYEYLHNQGVEFHIEPESASGRIDLISTQTGKDRLVADAKLFNPERGQDRNYLSKGFRQIYDYTKDFNESFGYLVIFKTCDQDLCIQTAHQEGSVPFITHNNKTIFLVVIDIYDYPESASKRGKLESYSITPEHLVAALNQDSSANS